MIIDDGMLIKISGFQRHVYIYFVYICMQNLFKHSMDSLYNVTDIPYFEGDFWPNIIEETIEELDQEAKERGAEASSDVSTCMMCSIN